MARAIKTVTIQFGMVSIPTKLFIAVDDKDISFSRLHEGCNAKLKQHNTCSECSKEVAVQDALKGYEYAKNQFIVLTEQDLETLPLPSKEVIEISQFVDADSIDPIFYEKAYAVEPDEVAKKPFALLIRSMEAKNVVALAKVTIRTKERLCALRLREGVLMLQTLHTPDEIRKFNAVDTEVSDKELTMAGGLIDMMTGEFEPENLKDTYREALVKLVEAKLAGDEAPVITTAKAAPKMDLMDALTASMAVVQDKKKANKKPAKVTAKAGK